MSKKLPIEHYHKKMEWHIKFQDYKCTGCETMIAGYWEDDKYYYYDIIMGKNKVDFAHNLARKDNFIKNYPLFIDSIINSSAQCHKCNYERRQPVKDNPMKLKILWTNYIDRITNNIWIPDRASINIASNPIFDIFESFYCQGFTYAVAAQIEHFLQDNPEFAKFVNMEV